MHNADARRSVREKKLGGRGRGARARASSARGGASGGALSSHAPSGTVISPTTSCASRGRATAAPRPSLALSVSLAPWPARSSRTTPRGGSGARACELPPADRLTAGASAGACDWAEALGGTRASDARAGRFLFVCAGKPEEKEDKDGCSVGGEAGSPGAARRPARLRR